MKVFVIGGISHSPNTSKNRDDISILESSSRELGHELAVRGHEIVLCSPFKDSIDYYVAVGAADHQKSNLEFHYPDLEPIDKALKQLIGVIPSATVARFPCVSVEAGVGQTNLQYSWLFAQLNALGSSAGVIAVGGKPTGAARLLFSLADAKNKSILPLTFLGGSALAYYDSNFWDLHDVLGGELDIVSEISQIRRTPDLLEKLLEYAPNREENSFFISYARARPQEADYVETLIRRRKGTVYRDEEDFEPASDTQAEIIKNIKQSSVFIAIWCKEYACSPWCFDELELAIERREAGKCELWIFCVDDTRMVPRGARDLNYYRVTSREEFEGKILKLINDL